MTRRKLRRMPKIKFTEQQKADAVKLYKDGNTINKVSELTGISSSYIKDLLKKYNIETRFSGFQIGNKERLGKPHTEKTKKLISNIHKNSGHKPSEDAVKKGQPKTLEKRWEKHKKDPVNHLIKNYQQGANNRNLSWSLSREDFEYLIFNNCYYCNIEPTLRIINNSSIICNGVDRVDNSLGYFKENCVSACKICNVMKSSKNRDEFIAHCCKIADRFQK